MLKDTHLFCTEADKFRKYDTYIHAPEESLAYREYWDEQIRRCLEGITINGLWIPGPYYFYLNFTQILRVVEGRKEKILDFPRFIDVDLEFFLIYDRAIKENKGIILTKPRRTGFSYKMRTLIMHMYIFFRDSKSYIGAFSSSYSLSTMSMVLQGLGFLDEHTAWKRQRNPDTKNHIISRYKKTLSDGTELWKGRKSEVEALTFKDNPFASAGRSSSLFIFEEGGLFDNIIDSFNISEPCWKDGANMIGTPIVFGSCGDMEGGTFQFHQMFKDPKSFNMLEFDNVWEDGKEGTKCGWFFPASRGRLGNYRDLLGKHPEWKGIPLVDKDGNSNQELAELDVLEERELKKSSERAYRDVQTQYPLNLKEAFLRNTGSYYPIQDLTYRQSDIESDPIALKSFYVGDLVFEKDNKFPVLRPNNKYPIREFPLKNIDIIEGAIEIYEKPKVGVNGRPPQGRYIAGGDVVDDDDNNKITNSLQSCFIFDLFLDRIVAEYTGRTKSVNTYYENVRRLCLYYNAILNYENNKKGLFSYFDRMKSLHLLADTPQYLTDTELIKGAGGSGNRKKGTPSNSTYMKKHYEDLGNAYLLSQAVDRDDGVNNIQTIRSIGLLQELIYYDRIINTDRQVAFSMVLVLREELLKTIDKRKEPIKSIFDTEFFTTRYTQQRIQNRTLEEFIYNEEDKKELNNLFEL